MYCADMAIVSVQCRWDAIQNREAAIGSLSLPIALLFA